MGVIGLVAVKAEFALAEGAIGTHIGDVGGCGRGFLNRALLGDLPEVERKAQLLRIVELLNSEQEQPVFVHLSAQQADGFLVQRLADVEAVDLHADGG